MRDSPVHHPLRPLTLALALVSISACTLGPDYQRPELPVPEEYRQVKGWKQAEPGMVVPQAWWELYGDPELNALVEQLNANNQNIRESMAVLLQSRGAVSSSWAALLPSLRSSADYTRSGSGGGSGRTATGGGGFYYTDTSSSSGSSSDDDGDDDEEEDDSSDDDSSSGTTITETYDVGIQLSWEADLWGSLKRTLESSRADAEASAADLAAVRLSMQSDLVQNYLQLRVLDAQKRLLEATVAAYQRSLRLTQNQYEVGIVPRSDVTQAETQVYGTKADSIDLDWQRAQYEHKIAVLMGIPPSDFEIAPREQLPKLPEVPRSLPSRLLERRPDVAQAERLVMAANAEIGVAETAWFPDLSLSASGGFSNSSTGSLFTVPYRYWSIGPQFSLTLFDFGARDAVLRQAEAAYDAAVANYRQTVLTSLQEVEDYLAQLQVLAQESVAREKALSASQQSLRHILNQYQEGLVDYLDVVSLQTTALTNERTMLTLYNDRLVASAQLVASLGGGWDGDLEREWQEVQEAHEVEKQTVEQ